MICRLCLITVNVENRVSIFGTFDDHDGSQIVKLIAKYFHLEVTQHDAVSTTICMDCWNHLDEFHKFWVFVDEKQSTLRNEFLEVKCDVILDANQFSSDFGQNEESLCDFKDVLGEPLEVQLKSEPVECNIFDETAPDIIVDTDLSDDDIPLDKLIKRNFKNSRKKTKSKSTKKLKTKVKTKKVKSAPTVDDNNGENVLDVEFEEKILHEQPDDELQKDQPSTSSSKKTKTKDPTKPTMDEMDTFISQNMELKCDLCETRFANFSEVSAHFREIHKRREYIKCCGNRHNKRTALYDHIKWHFNPELFKCDVCGKQMKNRYCLGVHKMNKHFKKEECIYDCEFCDKRFPRPHMLTYHIRSAHEPSKQNFVCHICKKCFRSKGAVAKHIQSMHENVYPHICDVCGMKFKFKPSFETHVLMHQGIIAPAVKCPVCGDWVKNQNRLRLHLTTHNKVDVHCNYCGRVCASLSARRAHIQYMHRRAPSYKCKFCEKFFKTPKILKEHEATHTGEQLYSCPHCVKEFRSSANMYVHIKRLHTEQWLATQLERAKPPPNAEIS